MSKYNLIYAYEARVTTPAHNAQQHCVHMSYTKFDQTGAILRLDMPTVLSKLTVM